MIIRCEKDKKKSREFLKIVTLSSLLNLDYPNYIIRETNKEVLLGGLF